MATAQARDSLATMTPDRLLAQFASSLVDEPVVRWMPDGRSLVLQAVPAMLESCAIAPSKGRRASGDASSESWLALVDAGTGRCRLLVRGLEPKPSPDGRWIAYVSGPKADRIAIIRPDGSGQRDLARLAQAQDRLSAIPERHERHFDGFDFGFAWSPDSRSIGYSYRPEPPAHRKTADSTAPTVREVGGAGDLPPDGELWTVRVRDGAARRILSAPKDLIVNAWFPDGHRILLTALGSFAYRDDSYTGEVWTADVRSGEHRVVIKDAGVQELWPRLSPDGRLIAFSHDSVNIYYPEFNSLALTPAEGGPIRDLTHNLFLLRGCAWSADMSRIAFRAKTGGFARLFVADTLGTVDSVALPAELDVERFAFSPDGTRFAVITKDLWGRMALRVGRTAGGGDHELMDLAPVARTYATAEAHEIRWRSKDSTEIAGYLIKPLGYQPDVHYPLLVDIHGGAFGGLMLAGSVLMTSPVEWQMWAAKGYVVLVPDYRASGIPGWDKFLETRERQDMFDRDFDDIMSGVDHLISMGLVDTTRMALLGHSYGSMETNWIVTHTHRFRVAVSYEGAADERYAYGTGFRIGGNVAYEWMHKGKPWEVPDAYRRNSSNEFVKGVTTPTLFISAGLSAPIAFHTEYLYTAWKRQGVDTKYLVYEDEGHVIQQPANQRDLLYRVIDWIDRHLDTPPLRARRLGSYRGAHAEPAPR